MRANYSAFLTRCIFALVTLLTSVPVSAANCHFYNVTIQGTTTLGDGITVVSARNFSINEYLIWRDTGLATHPIDFMLTPLQDLNASGQIGLIELMSNSAFARNPGISASRFDLATLAVAADGSVTFQMDPGTSLILPPPNVFLSPGVGTQPGGLGGLGFLSGAGGQLAEIINNATILSISYFVPIGGGGAFVLANNGATVQGQLELTGTGIDNTTLQGQYRATFAGNHVGSTECN